MKWNCFDWFDYYAAEKNGVPKLETQPIHTDAIWKRVQEQAGTAPQPKRNRMHMTKWVAGIAAAAVLVTGGTTLVAAAGYGGLDAFFQSTRMYSLSCWACTAMTTTLCSVFS